VFEVGFRLGRALYTKETRLEPSDPIDDRKKLGYLGHMGFSTIVFPFSFFFFAYDCNYLMI
jgi:hypothetical protein